MQQLNDNFHIKVIDPSENEAELINIWSDLQAVSKHSFFTSLGWMQTWIKFLPDTVRPMLVVGYNGKQPAIAFLLSRRQQAQWLSFHKQYAFLNSSGDAELDSLMIEYNKPLMRSGGYIPHSFFSHDAFKDIDTFSIPGCTTNFDIERYFGSDYLVDDTERQPSHYVDLDAIRTSGGGFLRVVSANRRRQITKDMRDLQAHGKISITEAQSSKQACLMLEDLARFHQAEWESRGEPGAFASGFFRRFHEHLIANRFDAGEIQMLAITVGDSALGYLYNFVYNGEVLFYQCGFNYEAFSKYRPGFICHVLAIEHNMELANRRYNFLAGDAQYKKSLSTDKDELVWYRATRRSIAARIMHHMVKIKRNFNERKR